MPHSVNLPLIKTPYREPAVRILTGSGLLLLVSAAAFAILFSQNPAILSNLKTLSAFSATAGICLSSFALGSCLLAISYRKKTPPVEQTAKQNEQQVKYIDITSKELKEPPKATVLQKEPEVPPPAIQRQPAAEPPKTQERIAEGPQVITEQQALERAPINYLTQTIFPPLFDAFEKTLIALINANNRVMKTEDPSIDQKVQETRRNLETLFQSLIRKPELYVKQLLSFFGKGKTSHSICTRRLIAAVNSQNEDKMKEAKAEYDAMIAGHSLYGALLKTFQSTKTSAEILQSLPGLLEKHFCLPDEALKSLGMLILKEIFKDADRNPKLVAELDTLRKHAGNKKFENLADAFLLKVLDLSSQSNQLAQWQNDLMQYILKNLVKKNINVILGMFAKVIVLLPTLLERSFDKKTLFPKIDETSLLSESTDLIEDDSIQSKLIHLQCQINHERKQPVALIVASELAKAYLPAFKELASKDLESIRKKFEEQLKELNVNVEIVPIKISMHPFKMIKEKTPVSDIALKFVAQLANLFDGLIKKLAKSKIDEMLPPLEVGEKQTFDSIYNTLFTLLFPSIVNGAIGLTKFRPLFEGIITSQGKEIAATLSELQKNQDLQFIYIQKKAVEALDKFTQAFKGVECNP